MGDDRLGAACGVPSTSFGALGSLWPDAGGHPGREDASPNLNLRVSRVSNSNLPIREEGGYFLPEFRLKTSIPLQNLKLFFGLEALSRRTRLLRLENQLIYLRGSVGGLIYRRRTAGRNFKRRACRGAE